MARFMKISFPKWFYYHAGLLTSVLILSVISVVFAVTELDGFVVGIHQLLGLLLLVISWAEVGQFFGS